MNWFENLMEDDIPPEWMWPFDKALNEWFEDIRSESGSSRKPKDDREEVPLMDNELAQGRR